MTSEAEKMEPQDFFIVVNCAEEIGANGAVARSTGKRMMERVEKYRNILLNLEGIEYLTPSFADEVCRVFAEKHPEHTLWIIGANAQAKRMVCRELRGRECAGRVIIRDDRCD